MRLTCYSIHRQPNIIPANIEREWMKQAGGFAHRCLPLNIANSHGWLILNAEPFAAAWNGAAGIGAITVTPDTQQTQLLATSHFGFGILTFHVNGLFRTDPGYDLLCTGPFNAPKDAISPLTGITETDWSPFTFTMNWKFTRAHQAVRWGRDEPFCLIFPVKRGLIEQVEPDMRPIESDAGVHAAYTAWSERRNGFNADLKVAGSEAQRSGWEKDYFRGTDRFGTPPADHRTKLRPQPFSLGAHAARTDPRSDPSALPPAPPHAPDDHRTPPAD